MGGICPTIEPNSDCMKIASSAQAQIVETSRQMVETSIQIGCRRDNFLELLEIASNKFDDLHKEELTHVQQQADSIEESKLLALCNNADPWQRSPTCIRAFIHNAKCNAHHGKYMN
jgi:hypothetical protein